MLKFENNYEKVLRKSKRFVSLGYNKTKQLKLRKMKYQIATRPNENTLTLQSIGHVIGTPAQEIQPGDFLMWNFGEISEITEIVKTTAKMIVVKEKSKSGNIYERKFSKNRLVCRLSK